MHNAAPPKYTDTSRTLRRVRQLRKPLARWVPSYLLLAPALLLLLVFSYLPAIQGLLFAFQDVVPGGESRWIGLKNFSRLLSDRILIESLTNLAILVGANVVKGVALPLLAAVLVARLHSDRLRRFYQSAFVLPMVVPGMVAVLLWKNFIFDPDIGLINQTLRSVGLHAFACSWLGEHRTALLSVILMGFPWVAGVGFMIFLAGLLAIPTPVIESARIDGVGPIRRFWSVELPLLLGPLRVVLILCFVGTLQDFGAVLVLTGGGPGAATHLPALHMYYMAFRFDDFGYAAAIGVILFLVILLLTGLAFKLVRSHLEEE